MRKAQNMTLKMRKMKKIRIRKMILKSKQKQITMVPLNTIPVAEAAEAVGVVREILLVAVLKTAKKTKKVKTKTKVMLIYTRARFQGMRLIIR